MEKKDEDKKYEELAREWKEWEAKTKAEQEKIEKEWLDAYKKDSAKQTLDALRYIDMRMNNIQAQIDASFPIGVVQREVMALANLIPPLMERLVKLEEKKK